MTRKLYDEDPMIRSFEGKVISCEQWGENYKIELYRTAFFPESGGQSGDTGTIDGVAVLGTFYDGERIVHKTTAPIEEGKTVVGALDFDARYRKMQNHTAEHIVSSIVYRRYGYSNVGFHIGRDGVTFDFNGEISEDEMREIETEANAIVAENLEVKAYYPSKAELASLTYRSKKELEGDVRIVEIVGCDMCACCAPHVRRTGEVGMIKILDFMRYKGGVRILMKSGFDALDEFRAVLARESEISHLLCVPIDKTSIGVKTMKSADAEQKAKFAALKKSLVEKCAATLWKADGNICVFESSLDGDDLRGLANLAKGKCRVFAALSGDDKSGYLFVCASECVKLTSFRALISEKCKGKCGGSDLMLFGRMSAKKDEILKFFEEEQF